MERNDIKRLLLSDTGNSRISVYKDFNGSIIKEKSIDISAESGPHGITVCKSGQFVFFANSFDRSLGILDIKSEKITENIGTGATPCHIADGGSKLYVSNCDSDSISIIDLEEKANIGVIKSGMMPHDVMLCDNKLIVAESGSDGIGIIDCENNTYEEKIKIGCSPLHIARLECSGNIGNIAIACTEFGIEIKGYICIANINEMRIIEKIRVGNYLSDIAADKDGVHVYVTDGGKASLYKVNINSGLVVGNLYLSGFPDSVIIGADESKLLVSDSMYGKIYVIDKSRFEIESVINAVKDISHMTVL